MSRHSSAFNFDFIRNLLSRRRDISRYAAKEDFKFGFQTMFFSASSCGNFGSIGHRTLRRNSCIGRNSIATLPTFFIEEGFVFEPDKCCKTYMLYVVYQYNIISCVLSKKQDRNKINNLSDSSLFTFHLVSSFALGCTKMFFKPFSPTTSRSSENILLKRIDELLQPKEKMSKSISSDYIRRNFYYPQR